MSKIDMSDKIVDIQEISVNATWNWIFFIISTISNIALNILYTNLLGPELYGEYKIVLMIYSLFNLSTNLISGLAIIKYASAHDNKEKGISKEYFKVGLSTILMIKACVFIIYIFIISNIFGSVYSPEIIMYSKIYFIIILIEPINTIFIAYNVAIYKIKRTFIISSFIPLLSLVFSIIAFYFIEISIMSLLISILLSNLIISVIWIYVIIKDRLFSRFKYSDFKLLKQLFLYSIPFFISSAIFQGVNWADVFAVSVYSIGNSEYNVGIYSVARSTFILIVGLMDSIIATLAPAFVNIYKKGDVKELQGAIDKATKYISILSIFLSLSLIILSPMLFNLIYPAYELAVPILQIFLLELPLGCTGRMLSQLISASNRKILYKSLVIPIIQSIVSIGLIYLFMIYFQLGLYGAVIGVLLGRISGVFYELYFMKKVMKVGIKFKYFVNPLISGLITLCILILPYYIFNFLDIYRTFNLILKSAILFFVSCIFMILFSIVLILLRTFDDYDYKNLKIFCQKRYLLTIFGKPILYLINKFKKS
ncbi:MAG: lipopolysaccharide biosynthesis protein [Candidatus Helarchaeota archaeon]